MAWARIVAECEGYPITIQGLLDGGKLKSGMAYFGFHGNIKDSYPFILLPDGRIDYGCEFDPVLYRFSQTDIHGIRIELGNKFSINEHDDDTGGREYNTYVIKQIVGI